jgi:hypothetical protein
MTAAHDQLITHHYVLHYPEHEPRSNDPHYLDFESFRRKTRATAKCQFAVITGVASECVNAMELHHSHIEFSLQNKVDLTVLERVYPGVSDPTQVGAWVESALNLEWLCEWHHRGAGGKHSAATSDYEGEQFVRSLISGASAS